MMSMMILLISAAFEVLGVSMLNFFSKADTKKSKIVYIVLTIASFAVALSTLSIAMQGMPLSVAYAIWTGIGAVGALIVGIIISGDTINLQKGVSLSVIICSAIMLKII